MTFRKCSFGLRIILNGVFDWSRIHHWNYQLALSEFQGFLHFNQNERTGCAKRRTPFQKSALLKVAMKLWTFGELSLAREINLLFRNWHLSIPSISGEQMWGMRCNVLHIWNAWLYGVRSFPPKLNLKARWKRTNYYKMPCILYVLLQRVFIIVILCLRLKIIQ